MSVIATLLLFATTYRAFVTPTAAQNAGCRAECSGNVATATEFSGWYFCFWNISGATNVAQITTQNPVTLESSATYCTADAQFSDEYNGAEGRANWAHNITIEAECSPYGSAVVSPETQTKHGIYPHSTTFYVTATPNAGYVFDKWVMKATGVVESRNSQLSTTLYFGKSTSDTTYTYVAYCKPVPIDVTLIVDGVAHTKTAYYGDAFSPVFKISKQVGVNHSFAGWSGVDTIGHNYAYHNSEMDFKVNLNGYTPAQGETRGEVTCTLSSSVTPNFPWRNDPDGGDGDSGATPNLNNPLGWVWVHARPIPSDGSKGIVNSPTDWAVNGTKGSRKQFSFTASVVGATHRFKHWIDDSGNIISTSLTCTPSYTIKHDAVSAGENSQGYEVWIYAVFEDEAPITRYAYVRYTLQDKLGANYTGINVCGLGSISANGQTATATASQRFGYIDALVQCSYTRTWNESKGDYDYTYVQDPVSVPAVESSPADGFYTVKWMTRNFYWDAYTDYGSTASSITPTIPADDIRTYGSADSSNAQTIRYYLAVQQPRFGVKIDHSDLDNLEDEGYSYTLTPDITEGEYEWYDQGDSISFGLKLQRTSGDGLFSFLVMVTNEKGARSSYSKYETKYTNCKGVSVDFDYTHAIDITNWLPLGDYSSVWYYEIKPVVYIAEPFHLPYCNDEGSIMCNQSGSIMADFIDD